jgi:iron complex outermembrane receptor protein
VTANKYDQRLYEAATSVSVLDSDLISSQHVYSFQHIAAHVPNVMSVDNDLVGVPSFRIRGVGLNEFQANFEGPVSVSVDQVVLNKPFMSSGQLFDVDRIEILKGLQTNIYGRNTIGGAINIFSKQPTDHFSAGISSKLDNYLTLRNEAFISGPVTDSLKARLAVLTESASNGPFYNEYSDERLGERDFYAFRNSYQWQQNQTEIDVVVHAEKNKSELIPSGNQLGAANRAKPTAYRVNQDYYPTANNEAAGGHLTLNTPVFSDNSFTSITAYEYAERDQREDSDNSPTASLNIDWYSSINQYSQEFRLHGPVLSDKWFHTTGLYFHYEDLEVIDSTDYSENPLLTLLYPLGRLANDFEQSVVSQSIFTTHDFHITGKDTFTLGARYVRERTSIDGQSFIGSIETSTYKNISTPFVVVDDVDESRTDHDLSFNIGLKHQFSDNNLVYGNFGTGFRSGGYDLGFASTLETFETEEAKSVEFGWRNTLFENRLSFELNLFRTEIENYQANVDFTDQVVPRRTNIGQLTTQGAEIALSWTPSLNWLAGLSVGYTDAELSSDKTVSGISINGNTPVNTPEFSAAANIAYEKLFAHDYVFRVESYLNWIGARYLEVQNLSSQRVDDYYTLDARISLTSTSDKWSVSLWGKNITNQDYLLYINDVPSITFLTVNGQPARYGVEVRYQFD